MLEGGGEYLDNFSGRGGQNQPRGAGPGARGPPPPPRENQMRGTTGTVQNRGKGMLAIILVL